MPARKYSEAQKDRFFAVLDRGGTVRGAAAAVGVPADTGYRWVRASGAARRRPRPRAYSEEDKARFFRLLAVRRNVSAVARELGFVRITCYKWAHQAGIFTGKSAEPQREEYLQLRKSGLSRTDAAARVGVDKRSAQDWDKGIRVFYGGRVYPDGRVVRYRQDQILAGVKKPRIAYRQVDKVDLDRVERVIHPRFLSLVEREQLHDLRRSGLSMRAIAKLMGRSASTISRELRRNTVADRGYMPHAAHRESVRRRSRPKQPKLLSHSELGEYVRIGLRRRWSPEQISHRLVKDHPDRPDMRVCTETIYQAVYVHGRGEMKREPRQQLRRGKTWRTPRRDPNTRRRRFVDAMTPITARSPEIETRTVPGHWEGDLVIGAAGRSAIVTLVERSTRYLLLGHVGTDRTADAVRDSLITVFGALPAPLRRTLTWDQGAEMSEHRSLTTATGMEVYFCEPASPWQRGSNENTNGLLRQYFPKGRNLQGHDPEALQAVATELNHRPRKCLEWDTPAERMTALLEAS